MRIRFSTDMLPAGLSHATKMRAAAEALEAHRMSLEVTAPERSFFADFHLLTLQTLSLASATASGLKVTRTQEQIARDGNDSLGLFFNTAKRPLAASQGSRRETLAAGELLLYDMGVPNVTGAPKGGDALLVYISRQRIGAALAGAEAQIMRKLDAQATPFRLLRTYATALAKSADEISGPTAEAVEAHIADLLLLGLGVNGDDGELARRRGLRAARLAAILEQLDRRCSEPGLAADDVGLALGISGRTVQHILQESGRRLSDELTTRRLELARRLLLDPAHRHRLVLDIALSAGFNDPSTFYRAFRARFGMTPRDLREGRE